jgi:hypothetical protein
VSEGPGAGAPADPTSLGVTRGGGLPPPHGAVCDARIFGKMKGTRDLLRGSFWCKTVRLPVPRKRPRGWALQACGGMPSFMDGATPQRARVISPWVASYDPALRVASGEAVTPGRTDPDNPGWRWCVNEQGLGGWLPDALVVNGRVLADFDSTELTVGQGHVVEILDRCAGWTRCRWQGVVGWVPETCLLPES